MERRASLEAVGFSQDGRSRVEKRATAGTGSSRGGPGRRRQADPSRRTFQASIAGRDDRRVGQGRDQRPPAGRGRGQIRGREPANQVSRMVGADRRVIRTGDRVVTGGRVDVERGRLAGNRERHQANLVEAKDGSVGGVAGRCHRGSCSSQGQNDQTERSEAADPAQDQLPRQHFRGGSSNKIRANWARTGLLSSSRPAKLSSRPDHPSKIERGTNPCASWQPLSGQTVD